MRCAQLCYHPVNSTHTYSPKQTIAANTQHETLDQVVERMRLSLIAEGYCEIEED